MVRKQNSHRFHEQIQCMTLCQEWKRITSINLPVMPSWLSSSTLFFAFVEAFFAETISLFVTSSNAMVAALLILNGYCCIAAISFPRIFRPRIIDCCLLRFCPFGFFRSPFGPKSELIDLQLVFSNEEARCYWNNSRIT